MSTKRYLTVEKPSLGELEHSLKHYTDHEGYRVHTFTAHGGYYIALLEKDVPPKHAYRMGESEPTRVSYTKVILRKMAVPLNTIDGAAGYVMAETYGRTIDIVQIARVYPDLGRDGHYEVWYTERELS